MSPPRNKKDITGHSAITSGKPHDEVFWGERANVANAMKSDRVVIV